MRDRKHRSGGEPPFVDPAFAEALSESRSDRTKRRKTDHKAQQVCRQVQRVLNLILAGDIGDDVLRELYVERVSPVANASNLLVHVVVPPHIGVAEVLGRLERVVPHLRAEIARAITRKRVPELTFLPAAPGGEVQR